MERYWHHWVLLYENLKNGKLFLDLKPKELSEFNNLIFKLNDRFSGSVITTKQVGQPSEP